MTMTTTSFMLSQLGKPVDGGKRVAVDPKVDDAPVPSPSLNPSPVPVSQHALGMEQALRNCLTATNQTTPDITD